MIARNKKSDTRHHHTTPNKQKFAEPKFSRDGKLKIMVMGGNEEVGRNMTILEYEDSIIIIDMGLQFPEEDMPGIDYIIPNTEYLKGKEKNIKGVFITHAHYDHIGGIPHLIPKLGNPTIYSSDLSLAIIAKRQEDYKNAGPLNMQSVKTDDVIKAGVFTVRFFGVSHNIPTSMGLIVETPLGIVVHTGDFKINLDKSGDTPAEIGKIARLSNEKVLALMADSTNASHSGHQLSESEIQGNLEDIVRNAPSRVIMGTFASLLGRIQQIIWAAEAHDKKVVIEGRSMKNNIEILKIVNMLKARKETFITLEEMVNYPDSKIVALVTGAQGDEFGALMRISNQSHRAIKTLPRTDPLR